MRVRRLFTAPPPRCRVLPAARLTSSSASRTTACNVPTSGTLHARQVSSTNTPAAAGAAAAAATGGTTTEEYSIEHHHVQSSHVKAQYPPPLQTKQSALIQSELEYARLHEASLEDPESFWGDIAASFTWNRKWDSVLKYDFTEPRIEWFGGAQLNISVNAIDRHIAAGYGSRPALTFEADDGSSQTFTFQNVHDQVCAAAHVLEHNGVKKGSTVSVCMPMVPALFFTLLACARIGAVHSAVFAGFSAEAVADRIVNCKSQVMVTADAGVRGGKIVPLKSVVDRAIEIAANKGVTVNKLLVTHRAGTGAYEGAPGWVAGRDVAYDAQIEEVFRSFAARGESVTFTPAVMNAEDPLFILYTSGSTGAPKGVVHTTAGYMVWAATTFKYVFDTRPSAAPFPAVRDARTPRPDLHFCTADIGWVTGHSYITYGPMLNGTHTLLFEGTPTYPGPNRLWEIVEKHRATTLYTAPTAVRALMVHGKEPVLQHDVSSLRILGSVGEPINPEAWRWLHTTVGKGRLPIVDTWWQTETGGIMITSLPGATTMKPGAATKPFFGVDAKVVRSNGTECEDNEAGFLVVDKPWPGIMRTVYGDHERFKKTYFSQMPGRYFTGDGAVRDDDGDIQILGRTDDVINVSGHRLGTAEVEAALALHRNVVEAAVVGFPHPIKGEGIYAFVTLKQGVPWTPALQKEMVALVRKHIGAIAAPDVLHPTPDLPKTRSGKIMRRILRRIAMGESDVSKLGDLSTLADTSVVAALMASHAKLLESMNAGATRTASPSNTSAAGSSTV